MRIRFALLVALLMSLAFTPTAQAAPAAPVAGHVTTIAGTGISGAGGDGPATNSELSDPVGVAVDTAGNLYIAGGSNHRIQKVDTNGNVTTIAGTGTFGQGGDGPATNSALNYPYGVAVDNQGNVYIADTSNDRIQKVDTNGNISTIAGTGTSGQGGDGPATNSALNFPTGVAVDTAGNVYIADTGNDRIQKVETNGNITTVAGTGSPGAGGDGPATNSAFNNPFGVAVDTTGNLYIADTSNNRIQKVDTNGNITTIAGTGNIGQGDPGPATNSALNNPTRVAVDTTGNVYIGDTWNHRIQKVDTNGNISTIAGTGNQGQGGDGLANNSALAGPYGVAVDTTRNLYIADTWNHRIQKVVLDTTSPTINSTTAATSRSGSGDTINFSCSDTDGSGVTNCTATLDGQAVNQGDPLPNGRGNYTLVITATDNAGNTATETTSITVQGKRELAGDYANTDGPTGSIARLYMATFARNPEGEGFAFWETAHANGMTLQAIADYFVAGKEFGIKYGDTTNSEFVDLMYLNVMNRTSDAEGHAFWLGQLNGGMTKARMLLMLSESPEFKGLTYTN